MIVDTTPAEKDRKPPPFTTDRRCAHPDCITVISGWHPGFYCYAHEDYEPDPPQQAEAA